MFLLNNIYDRPYAKIYPDIRNVVFDISDAQLKNTKNRDWYDIGSGSIVCVITSSRKFSTFYRIDANTKTNVGDESGYQHVITGAVVAKLPQDADMKALLNKHGVSHPYLPGNVFSIGFNVANLNSSLDALLVKTKNGMKTVLELKRDA